MIVGITGKSCSGKNYIASEYEKKGFTVWDLDKMAHDVLEDEKVRVTEKFGTSDRKKLGAIVFNDSEKRKQLEDIIYPHLKQKILAFERENPHADLLINGALLHRSGFDALCEYVILVRAPYETRLARAMQRDGISAEDFKRRELSQTDIDDVFYACPVKIIDN